MTQILHSKRYQTMNKTGLQTFLAPHSKGHANSIDTDKRTSRHLTLRVLQMGFDSGDDHAA